MTAPFRIFAVVLVLALCTAACTDSSVDGDNPGQGSEPVLTTIIGTVTDEDGRAVHNATVTAYGRTARTDDAGLFYIHRVTVPGKRCVARLEHPNMLTTWRAEQPGRDSLTRMRVVLIKNTPQHTVNAASGGTVSLSGGAVLHIPAHAFQRMNGQPYSGMLHIAARWLNADDPSFFSKIPGDLFAERRSNGNSAFLLPRGTLRFRVTGDNGEELSVATPVRIEYSSSNIEAGAGDMPMWRFDTAKNIWVEQGRAVHQGNAEYVTELNGTGDWCLAGVTQKLAWLEGMADIHTGGLEGAAVTVASREYLADRNGWFVVPIPAEMSLSIYAYPQFNMGADDEEWIMGATEGGTAYRNLSLYARAANIRGTLIDCNGKPFRGLIYATGGDMVRYTVSDVNGEFLLRLPIHTKLHLVAQEFDGQKSSPSMLYIDNLGNFNIGNFSSCW